MPTRKKREAPDRIVRKELPLKDFLQTKRTKCRTYFMFRTRLARILIKIPKSFKSVAASIYTECHCRAWSQDWAFIQHVNSEQQTFKYNICP